MNQSLGTTQDSGSGELVVQFISLDRSSTLQNSVVTNSESTETQDATPHPENEQHQADHVDASAPIDSVMIESVPGDGARSPSQNALPNDTQPGGSGSRDDLESRYIATLKAAIYSKWKSSNDHKLGSCNLTIQQTIGGSVLAAKLVNCNLSPAEQRAFEAATLMAQPLPYAGFEAVFVESRTINVDL